MNKVANINEGINNNKELNAKLNSIAPRDVRTVFDFQSARFSHGKIFGVLSREHREMVSDTKDSNKNLLEMELNNKSNENDVELYRCDLVYFSSRRKSPITPVENCELQPIVIIRDKAGKLWDDDDESPDNPLLNGSIKIYYRWTRGPTRMVCTFHPNQVALIQCATTLRCFCGASCYKQSFSQLKRFYEIRGTALISHHPNSCTYGVPCNSFQFSDPDNSIRDRDDSHISLLLKAGLIQKSDNEKWTLVGDQRNYLPVSEDVGRQLKLEVFLVSKNNIKNCSNLDHIFSNIKNSPEIYSCVTTACCVPNLPQAPPRCILTIPASKMGVIRCGISSHSNPLRFKVFSWNILAEIYASQEAFPHCDAYILSWAYRKTRIIIEILSHQPDIVCLQEVQTEHFNDFFKPVLGQYGYEGIYKQKTTQIFTSGSGKKKDGRFTMDGCATFYKANKFVAKENYSLEFSSLIKEATSSKLSSEAKKNPAAIRRLLKDNVAIVILLEYCQNHDYEHRKSNSEYTDEDQDLNPCKYAPNSLDIDSSYNQNTSDSKANCKKSTPLQLVVANTHIVANPEANDVKIWQAQILVSALEEYLNNCYEKVPILPGLVICGDFNSTPDSALYRLLSTGTCEKSHRDLTTDTYGLLSDLRLGHSMRLRSAYSVAKAISEGHNPGMLTVSTESLEPVFTNYTPNYLGCLDYVFYTDEKLKLGGILELLDEEALIREAAALQLPNWSLPSPQRPSDHLPLLTEFEWNI